MKKTRLSSVILLLLLCLFGCGRKIAMGEVKLVSGESQFAPYENWIYSFENGLAADGERKQPQDIAGKLLAVPVSDDIQIVVNGKINGQPTYTLYDESYNKIYANNNEFLLPNQMGQYILCVEVTWGTKKAYEGYQYFFRMEK